ncbi:MAG TPA: hypothetical protein VGM34_03460 [Chlamydiales bacterium]|jgi:hypothetical protein
MKKALSLAIATALIVTPAFAQTTTGEGASAQVKTATSNGWQKWVFGVTAIVIAAGAITAVALSQGSSPQSH